MNQIDLLLVGDATDGPLEEVRPVRSLDELYRLYGGYSYERSMLLSGTTSLTLSALPWANRVEPLVADSDGTLLSTRLYEFSPSGSTLTWNALGEARTVIFRITTVPGPRSLLKGVLAARRTGTSLWVVRLGEGAAIAGTAPSGGMTFFARYPGRRYNGTQLTVGSTGRVTITPAPGTGRAWTYQAASDVDLRLQLANDVARGRESVYLGGAAAAGSFTLPAGTYTLTGGVDGTFSVSGLIQFLTDYDLAGVDVLCPVGLLTPEASGALPTLLDQDYPTLLVAQAPASGDALSGTVNLSQRLVSVAFQARYDAGRPEERFDDAAPLVAALIAGRRYGITLAQLPEAPALPHYSPNALSALASGGHLAAYRSISKGWALWQAVTGDPDWPVATLRSYQEIARAVYSTLEPLLGNTLLDLPGVEAALTNAFAGVTGSRVVAFRLFLAGDVLSCHLQFRPWGEVRTVQAQLAIATQATVDPV